VTLFHVFMTLCDILFSYYDVLKRFVVFYDVYWPLKNDDLSWYLKDFWWRYWRSFRFFFCRSFSFVNRYCRNVVKIRLLLQLWTDHCCKTGFLLVFRTHLRRRCQTRTGSRWRSLESYSTNEFQCIGKLDRKHMHENSEWRPQYDILTTKILTK